MEALIIPLPLNIQITTKNGSPALEIRKIITEPEIIKNIIRAAKAKQNIIASPQFTDIIKSYSSMMEKGIIEFDRETDQYYFLI